jgi:superfamily II DNA or RNA helicase
VVDVLILKIDNRVRIGEGLPDELRDQIRRAFTYDNPDYAKALVFGFYKRVPRYIVSWQDRTDAAGPGGLSVPRGGLERVEAILRAAGMAYFVEDHTTSGDRVEIPTSKVVPYDYQDRLIDAAMAKFGLVDSVAMWRSVCASGKTTAALILATKMQLKTLVIISNGVLMRQWCDRVKTELGFAPGVVGGGKYDVSPPIVVAMQQSMPKMPKEDVDRFGLLIGDEIQLFAANTFQASVDRFPARCRLGVSGDERRADGKECLVYDQFGSVTAEVLASELVASGRIHEVEVRVVPTSFRSDWWTAIDSMPPRPGEEMAKTIQRRVQAKIRQAERLAAELGADETRNATIVQLAQESVDQTGQALVLSTRREHCHVLDAALTSVGLKSGLLIGGADYRDEFARTLRAFVARSIQVAVGTYQAIGVGFDLPAVARGICASPVANSPGGDKQWRQYRGRFARTTGGKSDAAIYYLWDQHVFGLKTLRHLVRWNARVVVRDGDDWIPAKQWLERSVDDGPKKKRHADDKQSRQRVIPGFDTDPERGRSSLPHRRTRSSVRSDDDSPTESGRERSVGVPTDRRTRTQAGGRV